MANELAATDRNADLIQFDESKVALIKRTIAPTASDDELEMFLHQCRRTGLDPLAKQIYFQKYNSKNGPKVSIITGIDGYRLVADRTGLYAGSDDAVFEGRITQERYQDSKRVPSKATVTVYKIVHGKRVPFTSSAYWDEYYPGDKMGHMWFKMPHVMLAKAAEAQALRKAFPADLSGVYTREEMDQAVAEWEDLPTNEAPKIEEATGEIAPDADTRAETSPQAQAERKRPEPVNGSDPSGARQAAEVKAALIAASQDGGSGDASEKQLKYVRSSLSSLVDNDYDKAKLLLVQLFGIDSSNELTKGQASALIDWVGATKDNDYTPLEASQSEAQRLLRAFELERGQGELALEEQDAA